MKYSYLLFGAILGCLSNTVYLSILGYLGKDWLALVIGSAIPLAVWFLWAGLALLFKPKPKCKRDDCEGV